jgi:hypothetical protein
VLSDLGGWEFPKNLAGTFDYLSPDIVTLGQDVPLAFISQLDESDQFTNQLGSIRHRGFHAVQLFAP